MVIRNLKLLAVLLGLIAAGAGNAAALSVSLAGEACEQSLADDIEQIPGFPAEMLIACGEKSAARVRVARVNSARGSQLEAHRQALQTGLRDARIQNEVLSPLNCGEPQWLTVDAQVMALACKRKNGGWPHLVLARLKGSALRVVDGAPSLMPVMLQALEVEPALAPPEAQAAVRSLFGASVPLATAADLERFRELINQARAANQKGLHQDAEILLRDALDVQTRMLGKDDVAIADTLIDLALVVSNQGRDEEADRLFAQASSVVDRSPRDEDRARLALYRGFDAANRGQFADALKYARAAADIWRRLVERGSARLDTLTDEDPLSRNLEKGELAFALNLVAQMAVRDEQVVLAQAAAAEALQIVNTTDGLPPSWRADVLATLGEISVAQGRLSAAETYLNNAIELRQRLFGNSPPVIRALALLGRAYQQEGMHTSALVTFRDVLKRVGELEPGAREILREEDLIPFAASALAYADKLAKAAERQAVLAEVFAAFLATRPSVVERTVERAAARLAARDAPLTQLLQQLQSAIRSRDAARIELALERAASDENRSAVVEQRLTRTIARLSEDIVRHQAALDRDHPNYQQFAHPAAPTLNELQSLLRPREGIVSFLIGRKQGFALLVTRDSLALAPLAQGAEALKKSVAQLRRAFVIEGGLNTPFDTALAHELYLGTLGGLAAAMTGLDHLILAQSGPLASLPFSVLLTQAPSGQDYSSMNWLGAQIALTQTPGIGAFHALRSLPRAQQASRGLLGLGDPALTGAGAGRGMETLSAACREDGAVPSELIRALAPLPESRAELQRVAATMAPRAGATILLGQQADERALRDQPLDQYRVLYFASHALLPGELKCAAEPALVLSPPAQAASDRAHDGLLEASEIAELKLNADLVVLSACNTAGGGKFGGDALSGLAEAFFHAGARNLVASHWQVPSGATSQLMSEMFDTLGPDFDTHPARALQTAQRKLIANKVTAHPLFWGAFVVVGEGRAAAAPRPDVAGVAP